MLSSISDFSVLTSFRVTSIKTRIETPIHRHFDLALKGLLESLPLKQGLKPNRLGLNIAHVRLLESLPLKQGLKPPPVNRKINCAKLLESLPLKQGLKR